MSKDSKRNAVLAVDPGGTTGWALWKPISERHPTGVKSSGQHAFDEFVMMADDVANHVRVVVCERYTITQQTVRMSRQSTALEVIGFLRYLCVREGIDEPVMQSPGDAKKFMVNDRLRAAGWLRTPVSQWDHANDALRHLGLYLVKSGAMELPR